MKAILPLLALLFSFVLLAHAEQFGLFTYSVSNGEVRITNYPEDATGHVEIPSEIEGLPVTSIGWFAFRDCTGLTSVTIPDGVTHIGLGTFTNCTGLTSLIIPGSVTSIAEFAFRDCVNLHSAIFVGNAPPTFPHYPNYFTNTAPNFTISYLPGSTGFTSPTWHGYQTVMIDESAYPAASWLLSHGLSYDTDLDQDLNGDGVSLLMAYALNLDPGKSLSGRMPRPTLDATSLALSFHATVPGITYTVETSTDLEHWTTDGVSWSEPDQDGHRSASVERDGPRRFLRLLVSETN